MTENGLEQTLWVQQLRELLGAEFDAAHSASLERRPQLMVDKNNLQEKCNGWAKSLADPNLDAKVRDLIQNHFADAISRIDEIDAEISDCEMGARSSEQLMNLSLAANRLEKLSTTIA